MKKNTSQYTVSVAGVIRDAKKKILLVKQKTKHDPYPLWTIPGGRVEEDENVVEALYREIREETGLMVNSHEKNNYCSRI